MSDELKALEEAFRAQDKTVSAGSQAKADTIALAMKQFEAEKNSTVHQGNEADARPIKQGNTKGTFFDWRNLMNSLNNKFTYGLAGSASVAVLAMLVVGPNINELLQPETSVTVIKTLPAQKPERIQEEVDSSVAGRSQSLSDNNALVDQVLESEAPQPAPSEKAKVLKEARQEASQAAQGRARTRLLLAPKSQSQENGVSIHGLTSQDSAFGATPRILPAPSDVVQPHYQDQGRDKFEEIKTNPVKVTTEDPVSTFSVDVDTASYAFMRSSLNNNVLPQKDAVRVEEFINYFDYAYETPADKSEPFKADVSIMPTPWNDGTKLLSIGIKGYELQQDETPPSNLVFLIDTSGSMNAPNKLPLLRNSFKLLLSNLKADDTISIVTYAGSAGTVLEPTKASDKNKILAALDKLHAGGSTAGAEGIRQAYALAEESFKDDGINRVILATDGDFNVGISDTNELKSYIERKRETGVTLSVLGFGHGNYNDELMQTLAQNGNGNAAYIDSLSEARKVLVEEAGSTLFTIAKDVKLQIEFNPALVGEYRLIGYETRALAREDFNNDKVDAGDIGAGHTVTALYEITPANSDARLVDDLRYGRNTDALAGDANEYGFLKIRYKLPESDTSTLITRPVTTADEVASTGSASNDARFAASVAAFGQILRGGQYTGSYSYDDVIALGQSAKGEDPFGYRAEFLNLVRLAKSAAALQAPKQ